MAQITVFFGAERRRRWSADQKRALVAAAFALGAIVSEVARAADIGANQLYRWRRELTAGQAAGFAAVIVSADHRDSLTSTPPAVPAAAMVVEIGRARVQIMANAPLALVSTTLRLLAR